MFHIGGFLDGAILPAVQHRLALGNSAKIVGASAYFQGDGAC